MSNIICRTESDSLNTQQWYKRNKAEEDMATKAVILVGGPGKVIFYENQGSKDPNRSLTDPAKIMDRTRTEIIRGIKGLTRTGQDLINSREPGPTWIGTKLFSFRTSTKYPLQKSTDRFGWWSIDFHNHGPDFINFEINITKIGIFKSTIGLSHSVVQIESKIFFFDLRRDFEFSRVAP